jgi:hypothetical protein
VKPVLQALLLADRVYEDKVTGKKIVVGIFHSIFFKRKEVFEKELERSGGNLPVSPGGFQAGSPFAYISLTEIRGEQKFVARYVDLSDDNVLFQCTFKASVPDPLQIVDVIVPLPPLPTNKAGVFALELLWKDEPLGAYRIIVKEMPTEEPPDVTNGPN